MLKTLLLLLILAASCLAQSSSLAGKWGYMMETPMGEVEVILDLKVEGETVTGTAATGERSFPIQNGSWKDGVFKGTVKRDGAEGGTMTYVFTAKLDGEVLKGSTEADVHGEKVTQTWEAKRK